MHKRIRFIYLPICIISFGIYLEIREILSIAWSRFPRRLAPDGSLVLYGDGEHNDATALKAWAEGDPVAWPNGRLVQDYLAGYKFRVDSEWRASMNKVAGHRRMGENRFIGTHSSDWLR